MGFTNHHGGEFLFDTRCLGIGRFLPKPHERRRRLGSPQGRQLRRGRSRGRSPSGVRARCGLVIEDDTRDRGENEERVSGDAEIVLVDVALLGDIHERPQLPDGFYHTTAQTSAHPRRPREFVARLCRTAAPLRRGGKPALGRHHESSFGNFKRFHSVQGRYEAPHGVSPSDTKLACNG
jgi:hypothetical protein